MLFLYSLLVYAAVAEFLRRCCMILITAYTGPMSRIPGPFLAKFTVLPWMYECVTGNMANVAPIHFKRYGDIVRIAPREVLVAEKQAIHKIVVEEDLKKAPIYEAIREERHVTSLFSETDKVAYKQRRRLLSPGFSIAYINGLEPLVQECIEVLVRSLNAKCEESGGSAIIDMPPVMGNLTSDVMSATSFGGSFNLVETNDTKLKDMFVRRLKKTALDGTFPLIKHLPFLASVTREMNTLIDGIIAKRRKLNAAAGEKPKKDLVQIFVDTNDFNPSTFTQAHIREEMILFMIAGSDTTSITVTFTLLLLLNNPEKLNLLISEINDAFPSKSDAITFAKTQDLPYLNAVINESMRRMPIIQAGLARQTTEPTVLCNYEIPAGTMVAPYISEMMIDPRHWPDPLEFIPERWLSGYKGVEADRKAFMPFSAGSRSCIGQQFALKELRLIMANLIRHFELTLVPGQSHELRVFTTPTFKQGFYHVGMKPRSS